MKKPVKIFISIIAVLIILCIAAYFILTSSFFLKNYAIPYLADKNGYNIKLKTIELSPFGSTLKISDLKIDSQKGLVLSTSKFDASISFFELLGGTLKINKLDLDKTYITIRNQKPKIAASTSTAHTSTYSNNKNPKQIVKSKKETTNSKLKLDINNINIKDLNIKYIDDNTTAALSKFNLTLNHFSPGEEGVLKFNGKLKFSPKNQKTISGSINSTTRITLSTDNFLNEIKSYTKLTVGNTVTPVVVNLQTTNKSDNKYFDLSLDAKNIMPDQIIKTFIEGKYHNTSVKIKSVKLNIQGDYSNNSITGLQTKINLTDTDINSEGNFSFKTNSLNTSIDINNLKEKIISVNKLILKNTFIKFINGSSSFALNNSNIIINDLGSNKSGTIKLNGDIDLTSNNNNVKGFISGKTNLYLNKNYFPEKINSNTRLKVGDTITPITVTMASNKEIASNKVPFSLNIKINNLKLQPLAGAFYSGPYSATKGSIKLADISVKGNNLKAFEDFLQSRNSNIEGSAANTDIELKDINIADGSKLLFTSENFNTSFNLTDLICGNITLNKLYMDNSVIKYAQIKKESIKTEKQNRNIKISKTNTAATKTKPVKKSKQIISLKNIKIKNLDIDYTLTVPEDINKSLYAGIRDGNINIPSLKTDTQSSVDIYGKILAAVGHKENVMTGILNSKSNFYLDSKNQPINIVSNSTFLENGSKYPIRIILNSKGNGDNSPFEISATAKEFPLAPVFKALAPGVYKKTTGTLTSLNFHANGNNINKFDVNKIKSNIYLTLTNTSIPVQVNKNDTIEAVFIPLEIISSLSDNTLLKILPPNVTQAFRQADWIVNKKKMLDISEGLIEISMNNGIIDINKFDIKGTQNNGLNSLTLKGTINNINKDLNLRNRTDFAGIIFPVHITGTISKPQTNTQQLVAGLLQNNSANAIKTGGDIAESISKTIDNIKNKNLNEILAPQNNTTTDNAGDATSQQGQGNRKELSKPAKQVINILDGFLNN